MCRRRTAPLPRYDVPPSISSASSPPRSPSFFYLGSSGGDGEPAGN
jgi:hypothetical protein